MGSKKLTKALKYTEWRNIKKAIDKAIITCNISKDKVKDDFVNANKIVKVGVAAKINEDDKLSCNACYLIVQNGNSRLNEIAMARE